MSTVIPKINFQEFFTSQEYFQGGKLHSRSNGHSDLECQTPAHLHLMLIFSNEWDLSSYLEDSNCNPNQKFVWLVHDKLPEFVKTKNVLMNRQATLHKLYPKTTLLLSNTDYSMIMFKIMKWNVPHCSK